MRHPFSKKEQSIIEQTVQFVKETLDPKPSRYDMTYRFEHTLRVANIGRQIAKKEQMNEEALVIFQIAYYTRLKVQMEQTYQGF